MLRTAALCGVLLIGLLTSLTISQTDVVSAGTNVWTSNSMRCPFRESFIERVLPVGKVRQGLQREAKLSAWQFA